MMPGNTMATFGTGVFILTHCGTEPPRSTNRLLSTLAAAGYGLYGSLGAAARGMNSPLIRFEVELGEGGALDPLAALDKVVAGVVDLARS